MTIGLTPEQQAWLETHVASGNFSSTEEAARHLIGGEISEYERENADLAWAKPYVEEGLAALERGAFITLDEHKARNAARLAALKNRSY